MGNKLAFHMVFTNQPQMGVSPLVEPFPYGIVGSIRIPSLQPSGKHMVYICDSGRATGEGGERPPPPRDFLGLALFGLICCCFPLGVIALIKSIEVGLSVSRSHIFHTWWSEISMEAGHNNPLL